MEAQPAGTAAIPNTIHTLDASAREHKRMERAHRDAARRDRQQLEELVAFCEAAGIPITYQARPEAQP